MARTSRYFQFPIGILKTATSTPQVVQEIVDYALWNYALSYPKKDLLEYADEYAEQYVAAHPGSGCNLKNVNHRLLCASAHQLNVNIGNVPGCLENGQKHKKNFGSKGRQCRIRGNILWSADRQDWNLLKFRVLVAVYAGIGRLPFAQLDYRTLRALGAGHNSPKGLTDEQMLSKDNVRYWIEQLWLANFFTMCKDSWMRFYSHRLPSDKALSDAVKADPKARKSARLMKPLIDISGDF